MLACVLQAEIEADIAISWSCAHSGDVCSLYRSAQSDQSAEESEVDTSLSSLPPDLESIGGSSD